jgi:hypothetical protein
MPRIENLTPKMVDDEVISEVLSLWREAVFLEHGKREGKKTLARYFNEGVVLQIEAGEVVNMFDYGDLEESQLSGMTGSGWIVYPGLKNLGKTSSFMTNVWETEASCPEEVNMQKKRGHRKKYRHANHSQQVRSKNKEIARAVNSRRRKKDKR